MGAGSVPVWEPKVTVRFALGASTEAVTCKEANAA